MGSTVKALGGAAMLCFVIPAHGAPPPLWDISSEDILQERGIGYRRLRGKPKEVIDLTKTVIIADPTPATQDVDEGKSIRPITIPIKQSDEEWGQEGKGISMDSTGEPKSGTTWTERVTTELALRLCGSENNQWCTLGGLMVFPRKPDPAYVWELLHADTGDLFLHFDGRMKHSIPGLRVEKECIPEGRFHPRGFAKGYPCDDHDSISREKLLRCLPLRTSQCASTMPSRYPDVRRMSVVFRDPRDVVLSSHRYRTETVVVGYQHVEHDLFAFIDHYFEIIVAWQHQRWVWHTTFYNDVSHVMFYEDMKANHLLLVDLAAFMGLDCTPQQAYEVWELHRESSSHGGYETYGLPIETIEYMNATMSKLLPEEMLTRYGLSLSAH